VLTDTAERLVSRAAEGAVLGAMVIDSSCIDGVLSIVNVADFALPEHQTIFKTICQLHRDNNKALDGLILRDALDVQGQLERVGGVDYIRQILEGVPSAASADYYANLVREKSQRRRLCESLRRMQEIADGNEPVGEAVSEVQAIAAGLNGAIEGSTDSQAILKSLADVEALPIHWFWFNRVPMGMLTLIVGDPGLGKSFLSLYMAAKISTGGAWPDCDSLPDNRAPEGSVVILSAEDDLSRTIRPRLDWLGADSSKVFALEGVRLKDENDRQYEGYFNLGRDLPALRQAVRGCNDCKLVIIDPLSAYLGRDVDSHRDSDVRSVLAPLVQFAEESGVAVVGVSHLNKNTTGKAVYRAIGSIAFLAAARTVWLVSTDPDDAKSRRRLLTPAKHNVLIDPTGLAFELIDGKVCFEDEPITLSSDEALGQGGGVQAVEKNRAVAWLKEVLPPGTSLASTEVSEQAKAQGISESTLRRAKPEAGVTSCLEYIGEKRQWFVHIPR